MCSFGQAVYTHTNSDCTTYDYCQNNSSCTSSGGSNTTSDSCKCSIDPDCHWLASWAEGGKKINTACSGGWCQYKNTGGVWEGCA